MYHRLRRYGLPAVLLTAAAWGACENRAAAWGNGNLCINGHTVTFPNETSYYAALTNNPNATEGNCKPTPTTAPEVPPSSTSSTTTPPPASSSSTSTTPTTPASSTPETSVVPPSSVSTPPSTPSSTTEILVTDTVPIPPGSCLATGNCPTDETATSSTSYVPPSSTPSHASPSTPPRLHPPAPSQPVASSTTSTLPATGPATDGIIPAAFLVLGLGVLAKIAARRRA